MFFLCQGIHLEFHEEAKSWIEALAHCQRNNSSLVEICNKTVRVEVKNLLQNKILQDGVWIGLERPIFGNKDEWKWISGSKLLNAQLNSTDSVNGFNNHCGKIVFVNETKEIKWLDASCHEKIPYICKGKLLICLGQSGMILIPNVKFSPFPGLKF